MFSGVNKVPGVNKVRSAFAGKFTAQKTAARRVVGSSSGARQRIAGSRVGMYARKNPVKATGMGAMGLGAAGYVGGGRRGRAVDKTTGRPTGMRRY